ncbi:MAG: hypothetical protein KAU24_02740, partial [Candidatus Aenigmarchaeota archaeon]|nr:hypothetical protein [Candidatus Aenigmarchaeota archaeon]
LLKRIKRTDGESSNVWYYLDEIADAPLNILHESGFGVRILVWKPKILDMDKKDDMRVAKQLLSGFEGLSGRSIVLDEAGEIEDVFKNMYGKGSKGLIIDCSKKPAITEDFIRRRLCSVLGIDPSDEVYVDLTREDMTIDTLFNIFSILEALHKKKIDLDDLRRFDLLRGKPEMFLVDELFKKGRQEVLRYDFREVIPERFFGQLYRALILKLRVKSMSYMQSTVASSKLGLSLFYYYQCKEEVRKMDFQDLYRRLYLVFSLLRWRDNLGSVYLLLLYW